MNRYPYSLMNRFASATLSLFLLAACAPSSRVEVAPPASTPTLDRSAIPAPAATPAVDFPEIERRTLANGLPVLIVERQDLPLVVMQLVVNTGSTAEPKGRAGLASLTAAMLDEGTTKRSALQIADEIDFLGANLSTGAGYDASYVILNTLRRNLEPALDVFADIVTQPAFPTREIARVRNERLTSILEELDRPTVVAEQQFATRIYGPNHPYGWPTQGTAVTVPGINGSQIREFYRTYYRPNNAHLIVVGNVSAAEIMPMLERALGGWQQAPVPAVSEPAAPAPQAGTRVYLIDKPGAAQSEIRIGHLGVPRSSEDYFPLLVMNSILGGQFSSRINLNLREDKGYTYGARSSFSMRRQAGPFVASAGVQTPSTKESVVEFMKELEGIRGAIPITDEEVEFAKAGIVLAEPRRQETNEQVAGRVQELVLYDLPLDYFDTYTQRVQAVTRTDVERVAREYLNPEQFAIVVVGDRSTVEAGLRELPYPVEVVALPTPAAQGSK
jgi:zinc protease